MSSTYFISTRDKIIAATHAQSLQRARVRSRGLLEYFVHRPRILPSVGRGAHIELLTRASGQTVRFKDRTSVFEDV